MPQRWSVGGADSFARRGGMPKSALACDHEGQPICVPMGEVEVLRTGEVERFANRHFGPDAVEVSVASACVGGIAATWFRHSLVVARGNHHGMEPVDLRWVNSVLGNCKNIMIGANHRASGRHLPRHRREYCFRFTRRFNLYRMLPRLGWAADRTPPTAHGLLTLGEARK